MSPTPARALRAVVFTDIASSTDIAEELGDKRWRELLARHHRIVRRNLKKFGGREIDTAGDGFFAIFELPADTIRFSCTLADALRELGIEIRAGVHVGEVEMSNGHVQGIAVHTGARVLGSAQPGEVWISAPAMTSAAGGEFSFDDRGIHDLKGVPGEWRLFRVAAVDGTSIAAPLDSTEAKIRRDAIVPMPVTRQPRLVAAALATAVLLAAVAAYALLRDRSDPGPAQRPGSAVTSGSAIRIDADERRVVKVVPNAFTPDPYHQLAADIAVGEGGVWIGLYQDLHQVDLLTDAVRGTFHLPVTGGFFGTQLETGFGSIWVAGGTGVMRVHPGSGDVLNQIPLGEVEEGVLSSRLAAGAGAVWGLSHRRVFRIDPSSNQISFESPTDHSFNDIAVGVGAVWAIDKLGGVLAKLDPITGDVVDEVRVGGNIDDLVVGEGAVWILDPLAGTVLRVDAADLVPGSQIRVGNDPQSLDIGLGAVWVAAGDDEAIYRIDPATDQVTKIDVGGPVSGVAVHEEGRAIWATISD
jgi:class 3 adenylate cyclase/streptogramin lyase